MTNPGMLLRALGRGSVLTSRSVCGLYVVDMQSMIGSSCIAPSEGCFHRPGWFDTYSYYNPDA